MSNENIDRDTHDHDLTYENEQSTVTIPLREYDKLKKEILDLENNHNFLKNKYSPDKIIGFTPSKSF